MLMAVRGGRRLVLRLVVIATMGLALGSLTAPTALAQPPNNDDFANATVITDLPFSTTEDTTQATFDPTDPTSCFDTNIGSVWFAFTPPSDIMIQADTFGSNYNTLLSAWTGTQGALNQGPGKVAVCTECPNVPGAGIWLPAWTNAPAWPEPRREGHQINRTNRDFAGALHAGSTVRPVRRMVAPCPRTSPLPPQRTINIKSCRGCPTTNIGH
jgi:hypothetical protein